MKKKNLLSPLTWLSILYCKKKSVYIFYFTQKNLVKENYWYILKIQELKARNYYGHGKET